MTAMLFFQALQLTFISTFLIENHLSQIVELSFIKSEQIYASMLAEMK